MNLTQTVLFFIGTYVGIMIMTYVIINTMSKGFVGKFLRVKMSRGALTLVKCHDVTGIYYRTTQITGRIAKIKDRTKVIHTIATLEQKHVKRVIGVNEIEVDLVKDLIICLDYSAVLGCDTTRTDELVKRAEELPRRGENTEKILLALCIIIIVLELVIAYGTFTGHKKIIEAVNGQGQAIYSLFNATKVAAPTVV